MKKWLIGGSVTIAVAAMLVSGEAGLRAVAESPNDGKEAVNKPVQSFWDLEGHWALEQVKAAVSKGYVDGYGDGTFRPDGQVTRAEFIKMVVSALNVPVSGGSSGDSWYVPYVNAAVANGLHNWSDFTAGDWNTPMTRGEMARLSVRAAGIKNDDDKKWMYLAAKAGLITGLDNVGTLGEDEPMTRAQAVTIIERILDVKAGKTLVADKYAVSNAEVLWHKTNIFTVMPQVFGGDKFPGGQLWDPDNLRLDTPDGKWSGEIDALIAIDLEDPNDPNRSLLPPMSELKWFKSASFPNQMEEIMPAYLLLFQSHVNYNYDTGLYVGDHLISSVSGINDWQSRQAYQTLSGQGIVYHKTYTDLPARLLPKKLKTDGDVLIRIKAPAIAPNPSYDKNILWVKAPEMIE